MSKFKFDSDEFVAGFGLGFAIPCLLFWLGVFK